MKADKMFEELGFKKYEWQGYGCTYYKPTRRIHFYYDDPAGTVENSEGITQPTEKEKKAISQKIKELRNGTSNNTHETTKP